MSTIADDCQLQRQRQQFHRQQTSTVTLPRMNLTKFSNVTEHCVVRLLQLLIWLTSVSQTHTHTHTHLTAICPGLPRWASTRKVKPIWILLKQETVSGSGISWAIGKSAPRSRQITTSAPTTQYLRESVSQTVACIWSSRSKRLNIC